MVQSPSPTVIVVAASAAHAERFRAALDRLGDRLVVVESVQALRGVPLRKLRALVLDMQIVSPPAAKTVPLLRRALPESCRILGAGRPTADEPHPFEGVLPFPSGPGVLLDRLRRALAERASAQALDVELAAEIELRCHRLEGQSLYDRLDLPPGAPVADVTRAFDALSERLHPDRVAHLPEALRSSASTLYAAIAEAGRVLRSPAERSAYHRKLRDPS
ncbi:MAG: hypothetical protein EA398_06260 [Deltaproteobacteria bacterium]|nr:MAG: hypothetical protein EA398_06260 [Deltaproteobacteria bacterium]